MAGGYFSQEELNLNQHVGFYFAPFGAIIGPPLAPNAHIAQYLPYNQKAENWSVFGSLTARLSKAFTVDLGVRYSKINKDVRRDMIYGEGGAIAGYGAFTPYDAASQIAAAIIMGGQAGNFAHPKHSDQRLMPSFKLSYRVAPEILTYASYTKGFKAGGFGLSPDKFELDKETVDAYEAGLKATLFNRKLFTTLAVFRSDYGGLQEATQTVLQSGVSF